MTFAVLIIFFTFVKCVWYQNYIFFVLTNWYVIILYFFTTRLRMICWYKNLQHSSNLDWKMKIMILRKSYFVISSKIFEAKISSKPNLIQIVARRIFETYLYLFFQDIRLLVEELQCSWFFSLLMNLLTCQILKSTKILIFFRRIWICGFLSFLRKFSRDNH